MNPYRSAKAWASLRWGAFLKRRIKEPKLKDSGEAERLIFEIESATANAADPPPDVADLFRFGGYLLAEMNSRTSGIDSKAAAILGWSVAALAFLTVSPRWIQTDSWIEVGLITIAVVMSLLAAVFAGQALRAREWETSSERDWFCEPESKSRAKLARYHLLSLLEMHRHFATTNAEKSAYLMLAQRMIIRVAVILTLLALKGTLISFVRTLW